MKTLTFKTQDKLTKDENPDFKCACGSNDIQYRARESYCGGHDEIKYRCRDCDRTWYVESSSH